MSVIEETPLKITLRLNVPESLANAIRRSVVEIPTLAIDEVEIHKNDSALYDEFLAHRIGLVPLKTEPAMNDKTEIELKLTKTGPGVVLAGDLIGNAAVVYPDIPLTLLEKGQEIEFVATARLGKGVDHEKYTPGMCFYRRLLNVSSKNPHVASLVERARGPFRPEKTKDGWICDLDDATINEIERLDSKAISDSEELIMTVESFGQLNAKDIVLKAIRALGDNVEKFESSLT